MISIDCRTQLYVGVIALMARHTLNLEDYRCFQVVLPVAAFLKYFLNLSLQDQPLLPALDVFGAG